MNSVIINESSIDGLVKSIKKKIKEGFRPTLAFVYNSVAHDIRKIVAELNLFQFDVFGATTVGEIFADKEHGIHSEEGTIVCMLLDIDPKAFALKIMPVVGDDYHEAGKKIGEWARGKFADASIITATSGLSFDNDAYTQGILSAGIVYAFGGAAGDDLILKDTFVYSKKQFTEHGAVALALNNDLIDVIGTRAFGWTGIGKERIVTKADKNIVYEIDGKPAVEFYKTYLMVDSIDMPQTGIEYPLETTMPSGLVVYRAVLDINDEDGSLIFAGHVGEKSKVRISAPQGKEIINYVSDSINETLQEHEGFKPDVALLFPCCSRKQVLGAVAIKEVEAAYKAAGCPMVGFYAYGEIGAFPGGYGFHNETFVTALLRERNR